MSIGKWRSWTIVPVCRLPLRKAKHGAKHEAKRGAKRWGEARGESRVTRLMSLLLEAGKIEEAREASNNEAARKRLFKKYRIE